ncbi:DNA-methyltransferase [Anaerobaca lacustris]|uniref:Methyltransferase n=1 Tax=Anaerobaca lacustris TaxID=3044600 RepID=A0AAW6TW76_9BACT|nr:site-specific DNA-methyltransferase [Sedimentisphaerales bacterium M17dextr]
MTDLKNQILHGDSVEILRASPPGFADLVFADPPFNIGYKYDKYHDKKAHEKYLAWTEDWIGACAAALKPHGSFYIAIGDEYAANIKLIADAQGLVMRNWIIWHYTFGQQTKTKFARAHAHIFYFVKDPKNFTFNDEIVRVISDRQKRYRDKRANPAGKMPDDVWNEYPRICGTFMERTGFPCQMPESLLARIIRVSSNEGDWVLDPFCGSGTTATVAHKLNRLYTSMDLSEQYVEAARQRIAEAKGLPIDGESDWTEHAEDELRWLYSENKAPYKQLKASPKLLSLFTAKLNDRLRRSVPYTPQEILDRLGEMERFCKLNAQLSDRVNSI